VSKTRISIFYACVKMDSDVEAYVGPGVILNLNGRDSNVNGHVLSEALLYYLMY
jgi:hypothetical protein